MENENAAKIEEAKKIGADIINQNDARFSYDYGLEAWVSEFGCIVDDDEIYGYDIFLLNTHVF